MKNQQFLRASSLHYYQRVCFVCLSVQVRLNKQLRTVHSRTRHHNGLNTQKYKTLAKYTQTLSLHGGLHQETHSPLTYSHETSIQVKRALCYNTAWDRLHAIWPVNKGVRQRSVPLQKIPFTIILTALHSGDSVKVCYKGRVGAKSARLLSELLTPQLLKLLSPLRSKLSKSEPKTFPQK